MGEYWITSHLPYPKLSLGIKRQKAHVSVCAGFQANETMDQLAKETHDHDIKDHY